MIMRAPAVDDPERLRYRIARGEPAAVGSETTQAHPAGRCGSAALGLPSLGERQQNVAVAEQRRTPADQIAAAQLGKCRDQFRLVAQPAAVVRDDDRVRLCIPLLGGLERIAPLAARDASAWHSSANVDGAVRVLVGQDSRRCSACMGRRS